MGSGCRIMQLMCSVAAHCNGMQARVVVPDNRGECTVAGTSRLVKARSQKSGSSQERLHLSYIPRPWLETHIVCFEGMLLCGSRVALCDQTGNGRGGRRVEPHFQTPPVVSMFSINVNCCTEVVNSPHICCMQLMSKLL